MYVYPPANQTSLSVTNGFNLEAGGTTQRKTFNKLYGFADDLTVVRGRHQLGVGANVQHWNLDSLSTSRTGGVWTIDGSITGLGLTDFLLGRVKQLEMGGPNVLKVNNSYLGVYGQDTFRVSDRVTVNAGVRWEPYFGQNVKNNAIVIFNKANFDQGIRSKVFVNAPPGLIYPGDAGFPSGKTGLNIQWWNLSPRAGVAWDVHGDGRLAVRSSYSMGYDFMAGEYHNINAGAPPFGNRSLINDPPGRMDDPWGALGGDPHPIVLSTNVNYIPYGAFGSMDPGINSPRAQQWNVMIEQQLGASWGVSASYLGSYSDRLWAQTALNPGVYLGLGPCTLNTATGAVSYPVCSTTSNLDQRRSAGSHQVGPNRRARSQLGRRLAEVSWPEADRPESDREGRKPQWQLRAVEVHGHNDRHRLQSDQLRLHRSGQPESRRGLLRSGPQAPGVAQHGVPDTEDQ